MSRKRVIDYNGSGAWTRDAILDRYARYRRQLGLPKQALPPTDFTQGDQTWIYPVMGRIIDAIHQGDPAAVEIGIELVEEDQSFAFGKLLKSDAARALRQSAELSETQKERLRARFTDMLLRGYLPREYKQYAKLFRKIGLGAHRAAIETQADQSNSFVRRWRWYLLEDHEGPRPAKYSRPW